MPRARLTLAAAAAVLMALAGCTPEPGPLTPVPQSTNPQSESPDPAGPVQPAGDPTVIAEGLTSPWSLVLLESGSTLISERDTALVRELQSDGTLRDVGQVPGVQPGGEGGLLGIEYVDEAGGGPWLYAYFTSADDNRIVRFALEGDAGSYALGASEDILTGLAKAGNHNGGRIKLGPDGMLYATVGDAGNPSLAQDPASPNGKILRIELDGSIPAGNPIDGSPVYSLGHRNPQGLAWDRDGRLWSAEFGQNTWDELNIIEPGGNYGWPEVEGAASVDGFINPVEQWATSDASPSGLAWTRDTFFLAALRGQRIWAVYVNPENVNSVAWFEGEFGRIRDVTPGPDGTVWFVTNNTDGRGSPREGDDKIVSYRLSELLEG